MENQTKQQPKPQAFESYRDLWLPESKGQWRVMSPLGKPYPSTFKRRSAADRFAYEARKLDTTTPAPAKSDEPTRPEYTNDRQFNSSFAAAAAILEMSRAVLNKADFADLCDRIAKRAQDLKKEDR